MKSLLVSTAVVILISGAALAQPDDRGGGKHQDRSPNGRPEQAGPDRGQTDRERGERGGRGGAQVQAVPAAAPAQVQPQAPVQAQARPEREQRQQRQEAQAPAAPVQAQVQAAPAQAPVQAQARPEREQRQQRQQRQEAQAPTQMQAPVQAPVQAQVRPEREQRQQAHAPTQFQVPVQAQVQAAPAQAQARPERQQGQRFDRSQRQDNPQGTFRNQVQAAPQVQAYRNDQPIPPRHVQQRNQWQSNNQDWNRGTVWQRDRDWWRSNDAFRNYSGVRLNFFFAPGFGYYSVPRQYRRHSWHEGEYLPRYFMRFVVNNYRSYGLPRPPYNCRWIWVNNSILLVDRSDRYILDEISNVW